MKIRDFTVRMEADNSWAMGGRVSVMNNRDTYVVSVSAEMTGEEAAALQEHLIRMSTSKDMDRYADRVMSAFRSSEEGSARDAAARFLNPDWWMVLGVDPICTLREAELAFRQKAKLYHPDSPFGSEAEMKRLNKAMAECRSEKGRKVKR